MKRSNSTPMIHELLQDLSTGGGGSSNRKKKGEASGGRDLISNGLRHTRNLSTSNASLPGDLASMSNRSWLSPHRGYASLSSPIPISRLSSPPSRQHRVEQIKKEEMVDERLREEEQDREFTEQLHLNQSWGDMKLDDEAELKGIGEMAMEIAPSSSSSSSAPQYYSPSSPSMFSRLHQPDSCFRKVRSRSLTPTSPVSTRSFNYYRRSCSPSPILRPSTLCIETNSRKRRRQNNDPEEMDVSPTQVLPIHPPAKRAMVFASPLTLSPCVSPLSNNSPLHQSVSSNESRSAFSPASSVMPVFDSSVNSRGPSCSSPGGFQSSSTSFNYPTIVMNNTAVSMPPSSSKMFHCMSLDSHHLQSPHLSSSPKSRHDHHTSHVVLALSSLTPPHSHKHSSHPPLLQPYQNNHSGSAFLPYKESSSHSVSSTSNHICDSTTNEEQFISSVPS